MMKFKKAVVIAFLSAIIAAPPPFRRRREADAPSARCSLWLDVYAGEPVRFDSVIDDCLKAGVIYIGERHGLRRHHDMQRLLVETFSAKGRTVLLGMEQMEAHHQPVLDRFNRGEIDFDRLASETDWERRWSNYRDYRAVLEACRAGGGSVLALNARAEVIRAVARAGLSALEEKERAGLPAEIDLKNDVHERLLGMMLPVHAFTGEDGLRRMYEARSPATKKMADTLAGRLLMDRTAGRHDIAVVVGGAAHFALWPGVPSRVERRVPGIVERIIILSESGDLRLGERERMMARDTGITHERLKSITRPIADYIHVTERAK